MGNGNHSRYNMGLLMIEPEVVGSKLWLIHFYQDQFNKFAEVGLGKKTEFDVKVTKELIAITQKRLDSLTVVYDQKITPRAHALRRSLRRRMDKEKLLNGKKADSNGTTTTQSSEDNSNTRHERSKS